MKTLRLLATQNLGLLLAIGMFAVLYSIYVSMHPNYGMNVVTQNSNEVLTLILVGMAQTVVVLIGGLDLSATQVRAAEVLLNALGSLHCLDVAIDWPAGAGAVLSERDRAWPRLRDLARIFHYDQGR